MDCPIEIGLETSTDSCEWPQNSNSFEEIPTDHNGSSSPVTPKSERVPVALTFGSGSSDVTTPNHDSDSASDSEFDSEAEAFYSSFNHHLVSPGTMDFAEKQMSYGELMKRFVQCEEELRIKSLKLQDSEQEIEKLKGEAEKKEYAALLAVNQQYELETARGEIEMRNAEIETEKRRVLELESQVVDLETSLSDLRFNVGNVVDQLEITIGRLSVSDAEVLKLKEMLCDCQQSFSIEKTKLETDIAGLLEKQTFFEARVKEVESRGELLEDQIRQSDAEKMEMKRKEIQLQDEIDALKRDLASRDERIEALNKDFDKHKLRYDMLRADKDGVCVELDNVKAEMRSRDIQIAQMKEINEKMEMKRKEVQLQDEINALKTDLASRDERIEALNKDFDKHKLRYDMLRADKDGVCAELDNLKAEIRSRDIQIAQMEEQLNQMRCKQTELVSESGAAKNTVEELSAMVKELKKQVELQRNVISEGEEEKLEAIRQLCFSLDHYKSGYRQVLRFLSSSNKQQ